MSNIVTDKIIPDSGSSNTLTVGGTGDSVVVLDSLNVNTLQDAGGNNIFVSNGSGTVTSKNSGLSGALNLISTQTASNSASLSFTSGLDSTYDVYVFKFIDINPATDAAEFSFQAGGSYNTTMTTTTFFADHAEDDSSAGLQYTATHDQAQGTSFQPLAWDVGNGADESCAGELHLFAPSSTTYVKHFYARMPDYANGLYMYDDFTAGYFNTTSALTQVQFKMSSGNFDGTIKLYGISKS